MRGLRGVVFVALVLFAVSVAAQTPCGDCAPASSTAPCGDCSPASPAPVFDSGGPGVVVCGIAGVAGVDYVRLSGVVVSCGEDVNGDAMALLRIDGGSSGSSADGTVAGLAIGGAVLGVMAVAFGVRLLRNFLNSSAEG